MVTLTAHDRLSAAREAALSGNHELALSEYVWFHDHALEYEAALYGVRLSFALSYWVDLGKSYPYALEVLRKIRREKAQKIALGNGERELFHDVAAIDRALSEPHATASLFVQLDEKQVELAKRCADLARTALVQSENYPLAAKYLPDADAYILRCAETLNFCISSIENRPRHKTSRYDAHVTIFVNEITETRKILRGSGNVETAAKLAAVAASFVDGARERKAVLRKLARIAA
jgi:hypothetical protein